MVHFPQVGGTELHRGLHPKIGDVDQLLKAHRRDDLSGFEHCLPRVPSALVFADELLHGVYSRAVFDQPINHPDFVQFFGRVNLTAKNDTFRVHWPQPARKKTESAHTRKHVEQNLREPESCAALGNDHIVRQSRLKTAAERISLNQRDSADGHLQINRATVLTPGADARVPSQLPPILVLDQSDEVLEITSQIEDSRHPGCQNQEVDRMLAVRRRKGERLLDIIESGCHVAEKTGREARSPLWCHILPEYAPMLIIIEVKFGKLLNSKEQLDAGRDLWSMPGEVMRIH